MGVSGMPGRCWYLHEAKRLEDADWILYHRLDAILAEAMDKIRALPVPLIGWPTTGFDLETTLALLSDLRPNTARTLRVAAEELALARERDGTLLARSNFISV